MLKKNRGNSGNKKNKNDEEKADAEEEEEESEDDTDDEYDEEKDAWLASLHKFMEERGRKMRCCCSCIWDKNTLSLVFPGKLAGAGISVTMLYAHYSFSISKWLEKQDKVVGSNPTKLTTDFAMTMLSSYCITIS